MTIFFQEIDRGVVFLVKATPKASASKIGTIIQDAQGRLLLKVYVTAVPEDNKANEAIVALLSKAWKIPKSHFCIISGSTDRIKKIRLENVLVDTLKDISCTLGIGNNSIMK